MLTGYNTDVPFEGVTYHVQTEDKGLKNPVILSLIYQGGTILGAKRTSYQELVIEGRVDETRLTKAIEKQHHIILAAIHGGKLSQLIERLKTSAAAASAATSAAPAPEKPEPAPAPKAAPVAQPAGPAARPSLPVAPEKPVPRASASRIYNLSDLTSEDSFNLEAVLDQFLKSDQPTEKISIELFSPSRLMAGARAQLRAAVLYDGQWPAVNATVRVRIVGTTIKPQTYLLSCNTSGAFSLDLTLPEFTTGTAALIIHATDPKGQEAELKLLIRKR